MKEKDNLLPYADQAGVIALVLNILTMGTGYLIASLMKLQVKQGISIAIESGIQNGTLAIAIATGILMNTEYAIAPAIYGLIMFINSIIVIIWGIRKNR